MSEFAGAAERPTLRVVPVIMAGGGGTRFWPISRAARPKQLLALFGTETLLEQTASRLRFLAPDEQMCVVTSASIEDEVQRLLPGLPGNRILAEPAGKNTGPAIALSAFMVASLAPDAVLCIVPSDHFIADQAGFERAARSAVRYAADGHIVTLGIPPTRPETGYGYIRFGDFVAQAGTGALGPEIEIQARTIAAFVEKPSAETALKYLKEGRYLWNSGMFFARADRMLAEIRVHLPELAAAMAPLSAAFAQQMPPAELSALLAQIYASVPAISIDYGVMEKLTDALVVPAHIGWSDVGSWDVVAELTRGERPNAESGHVIALEAEGNVLWADPGVVVAALGVNNLVVAASEGRVLVCPKERAQEVRKVVDELRRRGWTEHE